MSSFEKVTSRVVFKDEDRGVKVKTITDFFGATSTRLYISKLFSWFGVDFVETRMGRLLLFLKKYASDEQKKALNEMDDDRELSFLTMIGV